MCWNSLLFISVRLSLRPCPLSSTSAATANLSRAAYRGGGQRKSAKSKTENGGRGRERIKNCVNASPTNQSTTVTKSSARISRVALGGWAKTFITFTPFLPPIISSKAAPAGILERAGSKAATAASVKDRSLELGLCPFAGRQHWPDFAEIITSVIASGIYLRSKDSGRQGRLSKCPMSQDGAHSRAEKGSEGIPAPTWCASYWLAWGRGLAIPGRALYGTVLHCLFDILTFKERKSENHENGEQITKGDQLYEDYKESRGELAGKCVLFKSSLRESMNSPAGINHICHIDSIQNSPLPGSFWR
ncbi:hypothetical protein DFH09DRAFT_1431440 [Mycena vulgaris]|nr:hypothetical protein DFH09DRAFT_1431440 [Mycena vulgaris]